MKNALFVTANYYPHATSNCNCIEPLIFGLSKNGWSVDVVTSRKKIEDLSEEIIGGANVYRVDDFHTIIWNSFKGLLEINAPKVVKKMLQRAFEFFRLLDHLYAKLHGYKYEPYCLGWREQEVVEKIDELNQARNYDLILSVSFPFYPHIVVRDYLSQKNSGAKWVVYETDPFAYNQPSYGKNSVKNFLSTEQDVFESCDRILLTPELYDFYSKTALSGYLSKAISFPFPNMQPISFCSDTPDIVSFDPARTEFFFAGNIYPDIRNPSYAFRVMCELSENYRLNVMTSSSRDPWKHLLEDAAGKIVFYRRQIRDVAFKSMCEADVLVNLGNTVAFQAPGKVFEYMAAGKPIIHFQKIDDDPCLKYFEDYPMVLVVDEREDDLQKHAKMIVDFCVETKGKTMGFSEVASSVPQYIGDNVVTSFLDMVDELAEFKSDR